MSEQQKGYGWIWAVAVGTVILSLIFGCLAGALAGFAVSQRTTRNSERWAPSPQSPFLPTPERDQPIEPEIIQPPEELPQVPRMLTGAAIITDVLPDTPADKAGLRRGDVIIAVNGERLTAEYSLPEALAQYAPGDVVTISVWEQGRRRDIEIQLGSHPDDPSRPYLGVRFTTVALPDSSSD